MIDILPMALISATDVSRAIKCLILSKCVGLDGILSFIVKDHSDIFIPLLTYIFNLMFLKFLNLLFMNIYIF
jgi:hypothetical protein